MSFTKKTPTTYKNDAKNHMIPHIIHKHNIFDITANTIFDDVNIKKFTKNLPVCISSENPTDISSEKIHHLVIMNTIIPSIPKNITHLMIYFYDASIMIPDTVTHLVISDFFNKDIKIPQKLEYLYIGYSFTKNINLPNTLKTLIINNSIDIELKLPDNLETLIITGLYNKVLQLPVNLKLFKINMFYNKEINISKNTKFIRY